MQTEDMLKMHGAMTMVVERANGDKEVIHKDNLIVDSGFDLICDALGRSVDRPAPLSHIGVGTGSLATAVGQTELQSQLVRLAATYEHTAGTKVFTMTATFGPGVATGALTEAGVFNAESGGTMLDRVVFPVVNKGDDDTVTVIFTFTLS